MDAVFQALAHAGRRRILDIVKDQPGCTVGHVCAAFDDVSRIAVLKHLKVLEEANLLTSRKEGRRRVLFLNAVPMQVIYERWMTEYSALWAGGLTQLKYRIESDTGAPVAKKSKPKRTTRAVTNRKKKAKRTRKATRRVRKKEG